MKIRTTPGRHLDVALDLPPFAASAVRAVYRMMRIHRVPPTFARSMITALLSHGFLAGALTAERRLTGGRR